MQFHNLLIYETTKAEDEPKMREHVARERVAAAAESLNLPPRVPRPLPSPAHLPHREHGGVQELIPMLRKARLGLDAQALAQLAIWEPASFKAVVSLAKGLAKHQGRPIPRTLFLRSLPPRSLQLSSFQSAIPLRRPSTWATSPTRSPSPEPASSTKAPTPTHSNPPSLVSPIGFPGPVRSFTSPPRPLMEHEY